MMKIYYFLILIILRRIKIYRVKGISLLDENARTYM